MIKSMSPSHFANKLLKIRKNNKCAFFLGAGCSFSSEIPMASTIVKDFLLPRLREKAVGNPKLLKTISRVDTFNGNEGEYYSILMEEHFGNNRDAIQRFIVDICSGKIPSIAHSLFANLIANNKDCFDVILTTNFDSLIEDSFFLFTNVRPLVIYHQLLNEYISLDPNHPLLIKLHNDHMFGPMNLNKDLRKNALRSIKTAVEQALENHVLIFIGYGGYDKDVKELLNNVKCKEIYWVGSNVPNDKVITSWLNKNNTFHIKSRFDELMVLFKEPFNLRIPRTNRFESHFNHSFESFEGFSWKFKTTDAKNDVEMTKLKEAVSILEEEFEDWRSFVCKAASFKEKNPKTSDVIYLKGLEKHKHSASMCYWYAKFVAQYLDDPARAYKYFETALEENPDDEYIQIKYV